MKEFEQLVEAVKSEAQAIGLYLSGSRARGMEREDSDYDCTVVVIDDAPSEVKQKFEQYNSKLIELSVKTMSELKQYAKWGSEESWDRYDLFRSKMVVDKSGKLAAILQEKGTVPEEAKHKYIWGQLDHYINQVMRSVRCFDRGDEFCARLEAAESILPMLNAWFALHNRPKPYNKFLKWELESYPLEKLSFQTDDFLEMIAAVLDSAEINTQQAILKDTEKVFRDEGYDEVFDSWSKKLPWTLNYGKRNKT